MTELEQMAGRPVDERQILLLRVIGSVDLTGLEYVLRDGEFMGVIREVGVDPEATPTLQVVVRLQSGCGSASLGDPGCGGPAQARDCSR